MGRARDSRAIEQEARERRVRSLLAALAGADVQRGPAEIPRCSGRRLVEQERAAASWRMCAALWSGVSAAARLHVHGKPVSEQARITSTWSYCAA